MVYQTLVKQQHSLFRASTASKGGGWLTAKDLRELEPGQQVRYSAGADDYHCEAKAEIVSLGWACAMIRLVEITSIGKYNNFAAGDEISAAPGELQFL